MTVDLPLDPRVFYYAGFCYLVQLLSTKISGVVIPNFNSLPKKQQNKWFNKTISTVHAIIMFSRAAHYWLTLNPEWFISRHVSSYEAVTIDLMLGYLVYDTIYEIVLSPGADITFILHHILGFISHYLTRSSNSGSASFYSMMIYLAELSTPFLNISWLLVNLKHTSILSNLFNVSLLISFILARVILGPFLLWHLWIHWAEERELLFNLNVLIVVVFILLNYYWFYQLIRVVFEKKDVTKEA